MKLFVYGTLKRGYHNHYILEDQKFLGEYELKGFRMYGSGIPVISPHEGSVVYGELFDIDSTALARCDRLEGHPTGYTRITVDDDIFVYQMPRERIWTRHAIESGRWPE